LERSGKPLNNELIQLALNHRSAIHFPSSNREGIIHISAL
jgi:hypothetical protein